MDRFDHTSPATLLSANYVHSHSSALTHRNTSSVAHVGPLPLVMLSPLLRVAGIGDGLFAIFFFVALSVLICAVGLRTERPSVFCVAATLLSLVVILFLVLVPKSPPGGVNDTIVSQHTHTRTQTNRGPRGGLP